MFSGSGWSKSRLAKVAGAEPSGEMKNQKLHAVVARSKFESQSVEKTSCSNGKSVRNCGAKRVWKSKCEKHIKIMKIPKNTAGSDQFWKLRCWKSAHRCGAKRIFKWKWSKRLGLERVPHCCGALHMQEEVICVQEQAIDSVRTLLREGRQGNIALKKCTPSWREAHFDDTTLKKKTWAIGKTLIEKCDFWSKLSFWGAIYPDCIIRIPWQTACGKPFYICSIFDCPVLSFGRSYCNVWYDTCQCNCKSQLHHPFSRSEASFEFSLLEEVRMSSHSDMLHAGYVHLG